MQLICVRSNYLIRAAVTAIPTPYGRTVKLGNISETQVFQYEQKFTWIFHWFRFEWV